MNILNQPYTRSTFLNFLVGVMLTAVSIVYMLNKLGTHGSTSEFQFAGPLLIMGLISFWVCTFENLRYLELTNVVLGISNLMIAVVCFIFINTKVEWLLAAFLANTSEEVVLHVVLAILFFTLALIGRNERFRTYE